MDKKGFLKTKVIATIDSIEINKFKGFDSIKIENLGRINAFFGKNNSGKSSILHALDFALQGITKKNWIQLKPLLDPKEVIHDRNNFFIELFFKNSSKVKVKSRSDLVPEIIPSSITNEENLKSIFIWPDHGMLFKNIDSRKPSFVLQNMNSRNYSQITGLDMYFTINYYANNKLHGFTADDYMDIKKEIITYFPDIDDIYSARTEDDIASAKYYEYGRTKDLVNSGTGMIHFLDILVKATISQANIILLDEPEMGLHPDQQRKLIEYLDRFSEESNVQIFMATHSPVMLNFADKINYYKVYNRKGNRSVVPVPKDSIHTLMSDIGIKPSDYFNNDICVLVEGKSDVIFFEHIIREFYAEEFKDISIGFIPFWGKNNLIGIIDGSLDISNFVSAQKYVLWILDRDSDNKKNPEEENLKIKERLEESGYPCHILKKYEIEFYYPDKVLMATQNGDSLKERKIIELKNGKQTKKLKKLAIESGLAGTPKPSTLKKLLNKHMIEEDIEEEIKEIINNCLMKWSTEING